MSLRYKGAVISATPPTLVAGAGASGAWTLQQQMQAIASGYWPVNGPFYIEDVFSTYLYTGNGSSQTITNGIDLAGKGGLVWSKSRGIAQNHSLIDTVRGNGSILYSNLTQAADTGVTTGLTAFSATGYSLGSASFINQNTQNYVSWTFRKQPKFFDVVTYTGNGVNGRQISHALGSVPGCIIVKRTSSTGDWNVYHRSLGNNDRVLLNLTNAAATTDVWFDTTPTSTVFYVDDATLNINGETYVAYLFAHDAGGFGLTGTDNVISCGSFTTDGSGVASVSLGYEPQLILWKRTDSTSDWYILDTMRGLTADPANSVAGLRPNLSNAETTALTGWSINATGFGWSAGAASATYIYIAIRRGPMKTPTSGTSVFLPSTAGATTPFSVGFVPDMGWFRDKSITNNTTAVVRLTGAQRLRTNLTNAESLGGAIGWDANTNFWYQDDTGGNLINWLFRRAPGFFDVVCYTGTGSATTFSHNLGAVPQLMFVKQRTASPVGSPFTVYSATMGNTGVMFLNSDGGNAGPDTQWNSTTPTSSVFSVGSNLEVNQSGSTYVAYLFASCPGVSKVGSYTGTGTTQVIDCGFTAGSRFVMIKRVGTGDWYVWDSARGIVAGNDPYLLLNSTAAEVTNTDYVDTYSAGFEISSTAPAAINANGGTFIFLAIA